jgi:hypothetical protein
MTAAEEVVGEQSQSRVRQWGLILIAIGAFALALFIGTQVIGAFMGVLTPPRPPLPTSAAELSHTVDRYGRDRWVYSVTSFPDSLLAFYQSAGATCETAPLSAEREQELRADFTDASTLEAYCTDTERFDRFIMHWEVLISSTTGSTLSRLDVVRQIDWFGDAP